MRDKIISAIRSRTPTIFWGSPGVGKTAAIEAAVEELGGHLFVPLISSPGDVALPSLKGGALKMEPQSWIREAIELAGRGELVVIFVDELTTYLPALQTALLRFLDSGLIASLRIPPSVARLAAANPPREAVGGWDLEPPTANRLRHVEWKVSAQDFVSEFPSYWGRAEKVEGERTWIDSSRWREARTLVASFISRRPELLLKVPRERTLAGRAWPSPRTWDMLTQHVGCGGDWEAAPEFLGGAGLELLSWLEHLDLPDVSAILENPDLFELSGRGDRDLAVLFGIVSLALEDLSRERWMAAWKCLAKAAKAGVPDLAAVAAKDLARARNSRPDLPRPLEEIEAFRPLLRAAGI